MRIEIALTEKEQRNLTKLRRTKTSSGSLTWNFWVEVAKARGLDSSTILTSYLYDPESDREEVVYSALPLGHGQEEWTYPLPLKCKKTAKEVIREDEGLEVALRKAFKNDKGYY